MMSILIRWTCNILDTRFVVLVPRKVHRSNDLMIDEARGVMGIWEIEYRVDRIQVGKGIPDKSSTDRNHMTVDKAGNYLQGRLCAGTE
jgi:hypothetical protein